MLRKIVVHHTDNGDALEFGFSKLFENPCFGFVTQTSGSFGAGGILVVFTAVYSENPEIFRRGCYIGERIRILVNGFSITEILVDLLELFGADRLDRRCGCSVVTHGIRVIDIMIAGNNVHPDTGAFKFRKVVGKGFMADLFAIFGQVAGDKKDIGVLRLDDIESRLQDCIAFGNHFPVARQIGFERLSCRA